MKKWLLEPLIIGDLSLKNRIALAPMTRTRAHSDGTPSDLMATYYAQRASAGLLIAEATGIDSSTIAWMGMPGIYTDSHIAGWKKTTDAVHAKGGTIFLQLWHPGRATHSLLIHGQQPVAPSPVRLENSETHTPEGKKPYETPRALDLHEIPGIIAMFKKGAERAKEAQFDGIEIHAANGYLLDQFLQSKTNHRTDDYGGSSENRYRLLDEILQAVTTIFPPNRVAVRLSPNGAFNDMGSPDYREQFTYTASQLDPYGLAYLHIMDGLAFGFHQLGTPVTLSEFRAQFKGPLMGNCGYTPETAEQAIAKGEADMIAIGRPFISNPDLVERIARDLPLSPEAHPSTWYSSSTAAGYTDFPTAK
jgi:N-ethylmaleimide reductase